MLTTTPLRAAPPAVDAFGDPLPEGVVARLGTVRFTHTSALEQVAFSADGKSLVFLGRDGVLGRWDAATGQELARTQLPRGGLLRSHLLSADGSRLVLAISNQGLAVWDTVAAKELRRLPMQGATPVLAWLNDGRSVLAVDNVGVVRTFDIDAGRELSRWDLGGQRVNALAASPDGTQVVTVTDTGAVSLRDPATGKERKKLDTMPVRGRSRYPYGGLVFSPDGKLLVCALAATPLRVWDVTDGRRVERLQGAETGGRVNGVAFAPDGRTLATSDVGGRLRLVDVATGKLTATLDGNTAPRALRFSPDGRRLAAFGPLPVLELWDVATRRTLRPDVGHRSTVSHLAFLADGQLVTAGPDGRLCAWDAAAGRRVALAQMPRGIFEALAAPAAGGALVCASDGSVMKWSAGAAAPAAVAGNPGVGERHALTPDGRLLAAWDGTGTVRVTDVATGKDVATVPVGTEDLSLMQFSPDGSLLLTAVWNELEEPRVWRVATGRLLRTLHAANPQARASARVVAFAPHGRLAAALTDMGDILLWELATGAVRRSVSPREGATPLALAFTPDGRGLLVGTSRGEVMYVDQLTGAVAAPRPGHLGGVTALTVSADGCRVVSGGVDTTALVWDLEKLRPPTESRTVTASEAVQLWDALARPDGPSVADAIGTLTSAPGVALPLLRERLRPTPMPPRDHIDGWLRDLDSPRFPVRERASKALAELGEDIAGILTAARPAATAEGRRRIDALLAAGQASPTAARLQALRGLEVAELIGTPDARRLLAALAEHPEDTWLRREARATLARIKNRP